jgi:hypothetical protein
VTYNIFAVSTSIEVAKRKKLPLILLLPLVAAKKKILKAQLLKIKTRKNPNPNK